MFTGIVEEPGEIVGVTDTEDGRRLRIAGDRVVGDLHHGQSISVSGACLTVEDFGESWFEVFLAEETVAKTYLGSVQPGDQVNLERAMPADGRFDGHIVQGHVDTTIEITAIREVGEDWAYEFAVPEDFTQYVVPKGSIAIDGISLTIAELDDAAGRFTIAIIPTTYRETNLSTKAVGDPVHVEVDVLAKYVERMLNDD
ncbi:MAG: riboflavin synthase [Halobacteriales archaeon]